MSLHTALIVDDEPPARALLRHMLRADSRVEVVAEAATLAEARAVLAGPAPPRVVFLDLRLMGEDGFDLVPDVPAATRIVFVTADDSRAVRAFRVNALDYLLKPVEPAALAEAVAKLGGRPGVAGSEAFAATDRLWLHSRERQRFAPLRAVLAITACGDYSRVHLDDDAAMLVHRTLKEWEERLGAADFLRVHRNTLVNLARVRSFAGSRAGGSVELDARLRFEVSRRAVPAVRAKLRAARAMADG